MNRRQRTSIGHAWCKNWQRSRGGVMPVDYIPRIQEKYAQAGYPAYRWVVHTDPPPWQPLRRPLTESRLGLVASGGIYVSGQVAFHYQDDTSWRVIPTDVQ